MDLNILDDPKSLQSRIRKDFNNGERQLVIFQRQYFQRLPLGQFQWPEQALLRDYEVQQWIYTTFKEPRNGTSQDNSSKNVSRWKRDLWAELLKRVEAAVEGSDEPDIFDPMMEECARLQSLPLHPEVQEAQQDVWITYQFGDIDMLDASNSISLLERPRVLSGSSCTGYRTWEAALALGAEIIASWLPNQTLQGKKVLELGAGTGLLSFLCVASSLNCARRVIATDGDDEAISRLNWSSKVNGETIPTLADRMDCGVYKWGQPFQDSIIGEEIARGTFDLALAADVTYDPSSLPDLIWTLAELHKQNTNMVCMLSATVRNEETFRLFLQECKSQNLQTRVWTPTAISHPHQEYLFHPNQESIRFVNITGS